MWIEGGKNFEKRPEVEMGAMTSPSKTHTHTHEHTWTPHPHIGKEDSNLPPEESGSH